MKRNGIKVGRVTVMLIAVLLQPIIACSAQAEELPPPAARERQVVIIKLDDLPGWSDNEIYKFESAYNQLKERGIKASFGVMGEQLEKASELRIEKIKQWYADGFEIWHHGYASAASEYSGGESTYESQKESFQKCLDVVKDKLGIEMTTFGCPNNNAGETFVKMVNAEFPQIHTLLLVNDVGVGNKLHLANGCALEYSVGNISFDRFMDFYDPTRPYLVLQGHPREWDDSEMDEFAKILDFLISQDVVFMTPEEYYQSLKNGECVSSNRFDTMPQKEIDYRNAGTGFNCEAIENAAEAHTGDWYIRASGLTANQQGISVAGLLRDVIKEENIGKRYTAEVYVYIPSSSKAAAGAEQSMSVLLTKKGDWRYKRAGKNRMLPLDTWTRISMAFEVDRELLDYGADTVWICQNGMNDSDIAAEFWIDDASIYNMRDIPRLTATDGYEIIKAESFDAQDLTLTEGETLYSEDGDYVRAGNKRPVEITDTASVSGTKSLLYGPRTEYYNRLMLLDYLPRHPLEPETYRITARVMLQGVKNRNEKSELGVSLRFSGAPANAVVQASVPIEEYKWTSKIFVWENCATLKPLADPLIIE